MQILLPDLQVRKGFNTVIVLNPAYELMKTLRYGDTFWLTSQLSDQNNVVARFVCVDEKTIGELTNVDIGSNHFYRDKYAIQEYLFLLDPTATKNTKCFVIGFDITDESFRLAEPIDRMNRTMY